MIDPKAFLIEGKRKRGKGLTHRERKKGERSDVMAKKGFTSP